MPRSRFGLVFQLLAVIGLAHATGCSGSDEGPSRYRVSGEVTFAGKPVPTGSILFQPDASLGNNGPAGAATIANGKYDTADGGTGVVAGAQVVMISGWKGLKGPEDKLLAGGERLFANYRTTVDIPAESSESSFDIPAEAKDN